MALFVFLDITNTNVLSYLVSFALAFLIIWELILPRRVTTRYIYDYLKLPSIKVSIIANRIFLKVASLLTAEKTV